jgi:MoaA/NifB/PqqE/SkfB family radical SAM enzyme
MARGEWSMRDWSKAEWVDPALGWQPLPVTPMPERVLIDFATRCNLRCAMCPVWGVEDDDEIEQVKGILPLARARQILDELAATRPMIAPSIYGEPLLIPNMRTIYADMKRMGMAIAMNTNGLTLTEDTAKFFVDIKLHSIMFSIDAVTKETLKKIRGIDKLEKIESAVFRMMKVRGEAEYPRVGVSITIQDENRHELDAFLKRWVGVVDVVRTGNVFKDGTFPALVTHGERLPCPAIYKSMPIHNDGSVRLCCLDGFRATDMGNVFETSVEEVWNGEAFAKARYAHETGQWDQVPFCKPCNGWAQYEYEEEVRDGLLIRRSPEFTYFNRIDRLAAWKGNLLGGHKPPPSELAAA